MSRCCCFIIPLVHKKNRGVCKKKVNFLLTVPFSYSKSLKKWTFYIEKVNLKIYNIISY